MRTAVLKMGYSETGWDNLSLVIESAGTNLCRIIRLRNRYTALEVYRQTFIAYHDQHNGMLMLDVDECKYQMAPDMWEAIHSCLDQWFEDYFPAVEGG